MGSFKWKSKKDINAEAQKVTKIEKLKIKHKGKSIKSLSAQEKDELIEAIAKQLGFL